MVQKVRVELVCDACDEERLAERTVSYAFDGSNGKRTEYKIELCFDHRNEFENTMQRWIDRSREEGGVVVAGKARAAKGSPGRATARRDPEQLAGIRQWAKAHGFQVSDKGRIPAEVEEAYNRQSSNGSSDSNQD